METLHQSEMQSKFSIGKKPKMVFSSYRKSLICLDFEKLQKSFAKAQAVIAKEGIPKQFLAILVELEDWMKVISDFCKLLSRIRTHWKTSQR
jgi:hypothetical protein